MTYETRQTPTIKSVKATDFQKCRTDVLLKTGTVLWYNEHKQIGVISDEHGKQYLIRNAPAPSMCAGMTLSFTLGETHGRVNLQEAVLT
jgi:hypothetical protein